MSKMFFCTLFDSHYMIRGLAMYESLVKTCPEFHLYIFAFDDLSFDILKQKALPNVTVIKLSEFEDKQLLAVKPTRSYVEYMWTCTPSVILFCIKTYQLDHCIYLDADLYFYADPGQLIDEMPDSSSVMITPHRYTPKYDQTETSGKYCVQFMYFKNDINGLNVLSWWREACLAWCYAYFEEGKFGDQKYLDSWVIRFEGVHELEHLGGGMGPWNIQQYCMLEGSDGVLGEEILTKAEFQPVFYHFHAIKYLPGNRVDLGMYTLSESVQQLLYKPYLLMLKKIAEELKMNVDFDPYATSPSISFSLRKLGRNLKRILKRNYNVYNIDKFVRK